MVLLQPARFVVDEQQVALDGAQDLQPLGVIALHDVVREGRDAVQRVAVLRLRGARRAARDRIEQQHAPLGVDAGVHEGRRDLVHQLL